MTFSSQRERELVEVVRSGESIEGGILQYTPETIRWALRLSKALAAYRDTDPFFTPDDPGIEETDIVMGR